MPQGGRFQWAAPAILALAARFQQRILSVLILWSNPQAGGISGKNIVYFSGETDGYPL